MTTVCGITPKNAEQDAAVLALTHPECDLVVLDGPAGTGKTLLALAAGLEQTVLKRRFRGILVTRATISVGDEIGFLPGDEKDKMTPWMGAFHDNIEAIQEHKKISDRQLEDYVEYKSMAFMRGRSFQYRYVIIDEAQNLTQKQVKILITRAGKGAKVICIGDLSQIDHHKLTSETSGLAYLIKQFHGWEHFAYVHLKEVERSRLAAKACEVL